MLLKKSFDDVDENILPKQHFNLKKIKSKRNYEYQNFLALISLKDHS